MQLPDIKSTPRREFGRRVEAYGVEDSFSPAARSRLLSRHTRGSQYER